MSENSSTTELTSQYTAQVTADLERNAKEQERVGAEIAALQEQLAALQRNHTVLVSIQQAIASAPAPAPDETAKPSATAAVPAPRKKAATSRASKQAQSKKAASRPSRPAGKAADSKPAGKAEPAQTAQPTLVDLVRRHLAEQREPRSAAEIATALGQVHPERNVKTTVVRTTLEGLVAKGQAQRSKQGASVFYAVSDSSPSAPAAQAAEQPAPADA
ncbi:hypothetical protein [Streptomyces rishiriensis]|uniref:Regulatory protein n=1 Tax=Streptomyces rishiriensis TaxID=68264 RepID=A0ABU0P1W5_STRRH|nr:hypothetical protein [Streptomyces rishiriensis]MDQ0585349.1 hypothetical protein [Streptomyces rishiriensis]